MFLDDSCSLIEFGSPEFDEALTLRAEILRRPLGLSFSEEEISQEFDSYHIGSYDSKDHSLLATLTLLPIDKNVLKMRQVAVAQSVQSKGIGSKLVRASEKLARKLAFKQIVLHARDSAVHFYTKLGYSKVGEPFTEVGIPHAKMVKDL